MSSSSASATEQFDRSKRLWWIVVVVLTVGVFLLTLRFSESPPPRSVTLATGGEGGAYELLGRELRQRIERDTGLTVELRTTGGSVENFRLLEDDASGVDLAFVQSGVPQLLASEPGAEQVQSLAALFSEPLFVFYRSERDIPLLSGLQGMRIAIGPDGSGTQALARELLARNAITEERATLLAQPSADAVKAFQAEEVDAVFLVASPDAGWIRDLIFTPGARLMNMVRHRAYSRRLPYLRPVEIPQGLISLEQNLPPARITLLSAQALLMTRANVHPRVVSIFLRAAQEILGGGNVVDFPGEYPTLTGVANVNEAARRYVDEGESWLSRNLPFWAVRLISRMKLLLIPLLTVLLPAFKLVPALLRFRIRHLIKQHYEKLRDVESRIRAATTATELEAELVHAVTLRDELSLLSSRIPGTYQDALYAWRVHVDLVRREGQERLAQLSAAG